MTEWSASGSDSLSGEPGSALTEDVVVKHLKACQKTTVQAVEERLPAFFKAMIEQLESYIDNAKTNQESSQAIDRHKLFRQHQSELQRHMVAYVGEPFVKFKRGELDTQTGEEKYQGDMLSLVDNNDLEETIAISSITNRAENYYAEQLWCLNQRFSVLNHGKKVGDRGNPAGPIQYCEALRRCLLKSQLDTNTKIVAYKMFDAHVLTALGDILEDLNEYLRQQGFFPNLKYRPEGTQDATPLPYVEEMPVEPVVPSQPVQSGRPATGQSRIASAFSGAVPGMSSTSLPPMPAEGAPPPVEAGLMQAPDAAQPPEQYQGNLVNAIRMLQAHVGSPAANYFSSAPEAEAPVAGGAAQVGQPQNAGATVTGGPAGGVVGAESAAAPQAAAGGTGAPAGPGAGPVSGEPAAGGAAGPAGRQAIVYSNHQLVGAIQTLQAQAVAVAGETIEAAEPGELQPMPVRMISRQLHDQLVEDAGGEELAMESMDMQTIDLVGMLFEYMLSDDNLPSTIKALLSYLHTPFLKVAFIDRDFFEQVNHPARLLLNSMAEAAVKWVGNDGSDQYDLYNKIKAVVSKVLDEFENDLRIFAELLLEFSSYTKKIARRQELVERRALEKVQGEEKLKEVKLRVNEAIKSRIDNRELPSAVLLLLLQPWSDYLAFILLRYGEESDSWQRSIQVVDDLLWSIEPKENNQDKTRQLELHDSLSKGLEVGFETIGYDQAKSKKLLDALFSLQKLALQSKKAEPAPEPMRNKLESMAAEKAGKPSIVEEPATPEELRMVENLKMIEFGTWFEFKGGKRLKVAWYNSKTLHYMLVDQMGKKVAMKSGLELARAMLSHEARVIAGSSKPFFERALENIFQSLNAKAKEEEGEGGND